jgi:hypothetical protein
LKNGEKLPDGVFGYEYNDGEVSKSEFYTIYEADLSEAEIEEYLTCKQLSMINTIKKCVLFFTILAAIGIVACLFMLLSLS